MTVDRSPASPPADAPASGTSAGEAGAYTRDETQAQRIDRNFVELLQELRVIGAGVQILFAFLLAIAFQNRFTMLGTPGQAVYLTTLLLAALSTGLLISPVAIHRLTFHGGRKDEVVGAASLLAVAGLGSLALSMTGAVLLVVHEVAGWTVGACVATVLLAALVVLWLVIPVQIRRQGTRRRPPAAPVPPGVDG